MKQAKKNTSSVGWRITIMFKKFFVIAILAVFALLSVSPSASTHTADAAPAAQVDELVILWAQWDPADFLQEIGNLYEEETGIAVTIVQEPWGSFYDRMAAEWAAEGDSYDMVVGDSQWIGQGVEQGHYLEMTDFLTEKGIDETVTPATLQFYGEYPPNSGRYYAYPTEGDAVGFAYRTDLFEDPDNMAAFEEEYGYPLAVPETWMQLRDIAEFFTRPDDNLYGVGVYTQIDYDGMTMGFQNVFFSWGANWHNEDNEVLGVINSPEAVEALEFYKELYGFAPPGTGNAFFAEMNDVFISGQAAMIMNYFAFLPSLLNEGISPYANDTGYFAVPEGPYGDRFAALGGQGLSVISYISEERQQASLDFIEWFAQEEIQQQWADVGGYTCNINVLNSEEFLNNTPYNRAFSDTMNVVKDFWNIPQFGQLLEPTQRYLHAYVVGGEGTAQEALDEIAFAQDEILFEAGILGD
jgi:multiple sugar transport system substrate-binding protein